MRIRIIKSCACGREYTRPEWRQLPGGSVWDDGVDRIELRHCWCGSTLSIPAPATHEIDAVEMYRTRAMVHSHYRAADLLAAYRQRIEDWRADLARLAEPGRVSCRRPPGVPPSWARLGV